jgi:hypothetical protein
MAVDMKKAVAVYKSNAKIASDLERQSGVGSGALTFLDTSPFPVSCTEAEELSSSGWPSEPVSCPPAPRH